METLESKEDKELQEKIFQLQVKCVFGCGWTGVLGKLQDHSCKNAPDGHEKIVSELMTTGNYEKFKLLQGLKQTTPQEILFESHLIEDYQMSRLLHVYPLWTTRWTPVINAENERSELESTTPDESFETHKPENEFIHLVDEASFSKATHAPYMMDKDIEKIELSGEFWELWEALNKEHKEKPETKPDPIAGAENQTGVINYHIRGLLTSELDNYTPREINPSMEHSRTIAPQVQRTIPLVTAPPKKHQKNKKQPKTRKDKTMPWR